ncbi:SpoIIE family protein phosphatase [Treponema vincentii]|uniref:PP2C family protein-serine/threonine phosphatase n=1 Tax=Treponema vincentii TaxID=69710 RepID=UPI0020A5F0D2|nr:SpoIIE family protein phosphatase [Treponema vincentii]UTC46193.1 SpoIIE family protein phosphatase [Treponema vincentii]UTC48672.1 SpoIIE family protein phosphatase [Treponema vincentii]
MKIVPAAMVFLAVSIVCCVFFGIRAIKNRKNTRSVQLYNIALVVIMLLSIAAAGSFKHVSIPLASLALGALCFILLVVIASNDAVYRREYTALKTQMELMQEELIKAQRPDETAMRAKELLPVGNTFLIKAAEAIRQQMDTAGILGFINKIMIERLFADGGVILTIGEFEDVLTVKAYGGNYPPPYKLPNDVPHQQEQVATNFRYAEFPLNNSFFGEAARSAKPILIENAQEDSRIVVNGEEPFLLPGSLLTIPMVYRDTVEGLISLSRSTDHAPFTEADVKIGEILASYATAALKLIYDLQEETELNTIENETDIASRIQRILLPKKLIDTPDLNFSVLLNQARGVCSDYYDIIQNQKDRLFCITADVAGKSIHACIVMVMIRSLLYLITNTAQSTQSILDILNKGITGKISIDHYASISLLAYIPAEKSIEYVNAGTQSLLLWKASAKKLVRLEQKSDPIGVDIKSVYTCKKIPVEKGDIAVLFTDGIIETLNDRGEPFGLKALAELLAANASLPAKAITDTINKQLKIFMGKTSPHDDQTVMIIKVK